MMSDTSNAAKTEESEPVRGTLPPSISAPPSAEKQQEEGEAEGPSKRQLKKQARRAALAEKYDDHKNGPQQQEQQHQGTQNSSTMHDGPCSRQQRSSRASRQAKATAIAFEARKRGILEALRCDQLQQQQQHRHQEGGGENSSPNGTVSGSSDNNNNNSSDRTAADVSSSSPTAAPVTMMIGCDRSPKGSVDVKCYPLISLLNRHPDYVTTSSCSGRIAIFHRNPPPQPTHPQPQEHNGKMISSAVGAGPSAVVSSSSSSPRCGCEEEQNRNEKGEGESQSTPTITTTTTTTGKRGTEDAAGWLTVWHDTIPDSLVDVLAVELMQDRVMPSWSEGEETAAGRMTRRRETPTDLTTSRQQREAEGEEPNEEDGSVQRSSSSSSPLPTKGDISFLFEPFLMHVQCRTLSVAVRLQQIVLRMYRNSGLVLSSTFLDNDDEDEEDEGYKPTEEAVTHSATASGNRVAVVGKAAQGQKKRRKATAAPPHRLMLAIRPSPGFNIQVPLMKDGIWLLQEGTKRSKESASSVGVSYVSQLLRLGNQRMAENEERLNSLCRMIETELFSSSAN